jgi:hypothetical protein
MCTLQKPEPVKHVALKGRMDRKVEFVVFNQISFDFCIE